MTLNLTHLTADELLNIIDFIYPFFSEYIKALGGRHFEQQHKREYLSKIIFGILKGSDERRDWILEFRDEYSVVMGTRYLSSLYFNDYFLQLGSDPSVNTSSLYLRKYYEEIVGTIKDWMLIAKKNLFYEILTSIDIPSIQLFWESLFHMLRDTTLIMSCMKYKRHDYLELPLISSQMLKTIPEHVMKSIEEPVWFLETFIHNGRKNVEHSYCLGFEQYVRHVEIVEGGHSLYGVVTEGNDWTCEIKEDDWQAFLQFFKKNFEIYPRILQNPVYTAFINAQFERDIYNLESNAKRISDLAEYLYFDRNMPINIDIYKNIYAICVRTPYFNQILDRNLELLGNDEDRKVYSSKVFLDYSFLDSVISCFNFELLERCYKHQCENLNEKTFKLYLSKRLYPQKTPVITLLIKAVFRIQDDDPIPTINMMCEYVNKFCRLYNEKFLTLFAGWHGILHDFIQLSDYELSQEDVDSHNWKRCYFIITELVKQLLVKNIGLLGPKQLPNFFINCKNKYIAQIFFSGQPEQLTSILEFSVMRDLNHMMNYNMKFLDILEMYFSKEGQKQIQFEKSITGR